MNILNWLFGTHDNNINTTRKHIMFPPYVHYYLKRTGSLNFVFQNVDEIKYKKNIKAYGYARIYSYGYPRVIEIKYDDDLIKEHYNRIDLAAISVSATIIHEAAHFQEYSVRRKTSEKYPELMEILFLQTLLKTGITRHLPIKLILPIHVLPYASQQNKFNLLSVSQLNYDI
jgi:hypothetical protein